MKKFVELLWMVVQKTAVPKWDMKFGNLPAQPRREIQKITFCADAIP
jgi:hypothetical protein